MNADNMTFRRRNIVERKVLRLVRGETSAAEYGGSHGREAHPAPASVRLGEYRRAHFGCLRQFARRNGLQIQPVGAQHVTSSELVILRWLAEAQRLTGLRTCYFRDIGLKTSLRHCAGILKEQGTFLPPKTLHIHCDLDEDQTTFSWRAGKA